MIESAVLSTLAAVDPAGAAQRYVWEVEGFLPTGGEIAAKIGDLHVNLDLTFLHERRYALGFVFGFRNPQADIDRLLFEANVRPGDVVLDAGANIGVTAAEALAYGANHVICVEPEDRLVKRLNLLKVRYPSRMTIWHCALGASEGVAELLLSVTHNQGHTISPEIPLIFPSLFNGKSQKVPISTIDHVLSDRPADIWKLDVEGVEADVIRGARLTLKHSPPRVILAELYDSFVREVAGLLGAYQVQRAALTKIEYSLSLLNQIGGPLSEEFCPTSPMYVFTRLD